MGRRRKERVPCPGCDAGDVVSRGLCMACYLVARRYPASPQAALIRPTTRPNAGRPRNDEGDGWDEASESLMLSVCLACRRRTRAQRGLCQRCYDRARLDHASPEAAAILPPGKPKPGPRARSRRSGAA